MSEDPAANLAHNLRTLREARGLSQHALARLSGVPRPTLGHLESGAGNPTLAVLLRVASALAVSVEELIGRPRADVRLYRPADLLTRQRGRVLIRELLPDPMSGLTLERLELPPRAGMTGVPHTPGTREYLACEQGRVELGAGGEKWILEPGDVLVFRGDQKHGYRNVGDGVAVAYSVVALAPLAG